ncbi:MAG: ABC transporter permease [Lentimicrobium sp.]|nr:ABC transporter permease [Lentimicrobium sp.]
MLFFRKLLPEGSLSSKSWKKLQNNKPAVFSMFLILAAILISILGYLITPDSSPYANDQHLEIAAKKPGFQVTMISIRKNEKKPDCHFWTRMIYGCQEKYLSLPISSFSFVNDEIILTPYSIDATNSELNYAYKLADVLFAVSDTSRLYLSSAGCKDIEGKSMAMSIPAMQKLIIDTKISKRTFILGTDRFGRDVLSQLMIGTRVSLSVGFISVIISLILGILLGALAGFFRGRIDDLIIWFINIVWSIPTLLLVIAITFALGKGFWQVFIAVGLTMWVEVARVVRGQILSLREKEFVEAARALGFKNNRIIIRHILPNTIGPVIVISAANFASAILIEAGLSFLGIGVQPPMPSWGTMVKENYAYIILDNPWLALLPGACIMLLVLAFMLIGNGLRDALDVKAGPQS